MHKQNVMVNYGNDGRSSIAMNAEGSCVELEIPQVKTMMGASARVVPHKQQRSSSTAKSKVQSRRKRQPSTKLLTKEQHCQLATINDDVYTYVVNRVPAELISDLFPTASTFTISFLRKLSVRGEGCS